MKWTNSFIIALLFECLLVNGQTHWIAGPDADGHAYGVFHFRKTFSIPAVSAHFPIFISADERYRFFVNGQFVCAGPARGDRTHWQLDSIDIASFLHPGNNLLSAVVWNDGEYSAWAQLSGQTGFYMTSSAAGNSFHTDSSWKVCQDMAYSPVATISHITGAFEQVFAQRYPWGWEMPGYNDSAWLHAKHADDQGRVLVPRRIPFPEERPDGPLVIRQDAKNPKIPDGFLTGTAPLTIQPGSDTRILLDQQELTTAYPELSVSGGLGAKITLTYAESLYDAAGNKGNRNDIAGKEIKGDQDIFLPDGGTGRIFRPLYYRTYRYVQLHIENHQQPLVMNSFRGIFTAYPFERRARFHSNDSSLTNIWNTAWRTARLCAYETYMDCPYYEQQQYVGDTRIQALISLYASGDDRLMKNAITQIYHSMLPEGITQSRYPGGVKQIIPPFSLFWISMLHDYWMCRRDTAFIRQFLPGIQQILNWHRKYIEPDGMLGKMPYWNFVDWTREWPWKGVEELSGVPDGALTGGSSILTLQYVLALEKATELFRYFGSNKDSRDCMLQAHRSSAAVYSLCWDSGRGLIAETKERSSFSQHAQAMAVLTDCIPATAAKDVIARAFSDSTLIRCSYYYRFYLLQALKKAGSGNEYLDQLGPWKKMIASGLTTFAEAPEPTRSDCHAWSASPAYDLLATVCGVMPASPGFREVRITPSLGRLTDCEGSMPHPDGGISVQYKQTSPGRWSATLVLPASVKGTLVWAGKTYSLHGGRNAFTF